jgi:flagellar biosynthesis protein FlhF
MIPSPGPTSPPVNLIPFIANSAQDAVAQIRAQLGPQAVVVHVRPLPPKGLARLWARPRFEVLAHRPNPSLPHLDLTSDHPAFPSHELPPQDSASHGLPQKAVGEQLMHGHRPRNVGSADAPTNPSPSVSNPPDAATACRSSQPADPVTPSITLIESAARSWQVGPVLERAGLLPLNAQLVVDQLVRRHGPRPPASLAQEIALSRLALASLWRKPPQPLERTLRPHVFVGAPGVGKSTCLCKWLAQTVLVENRPARAWRLDHSSANRADLIEVYGEILGVPIERVWRLDGLPDDDQVRFIDLPGIDWQDPVAMKNLAQQLASYLAPQIHLVLNGAYDLPLLLAQVRAFSQLPLDDLIITHLDEENRWGKLWNLVLGTNCSLRFLSAGQNIPGDFLHASPDQILARQFPTFDPNSRSQAAPTPRWPLTC